MTSRGPGAAPELDLHTKAALHTGESARRAALTLAEATTVPADAEMRASAYDATRQVLTDDQISAAIWVAITINAFNRVSIMSKHPVQPWRHDA
jgi:alkylhydroperoxidase family enzyme